MLAWRKSRLTPPLITTSPAGTIPNLTNPETSIVFGDKINDSPKSGVEGSITYSPSHKLGFQVGGLWVANETEKHSISSDAQGVPSIGIPYFSTFTDVEAEVSVAREGAFAGEAKASSTNKIWGVNALLEWNVANCNPYSFTFQLGYQNYSIQDNVSLDAFVDFLLLPNTTTIRNRFNAHNRFNGGLLGCAADFYKSCWELSLLTRVGVGQMDSTVDIKGFGVIDPPTGQFAGFVQDSNRGKHKNNYFTIVPEFASKVRYRMNHKLSLAIGYHLIYWPNLYLAGRQIDRRLNPFIPTDVPKFLNKKSSFWLQGLTLGIKLDFCSQM